MELTFILVENPVWDLQPVSFHLVLVTLYTPTEEKR